MAKVIQITLWTARLQTATKWRHFATLFACLCEHHDAQMMRAAISVAHNEI